MTLILAWLVALAILAAPTGFFWCCCGPCGTYCVRVWCGFNGGPGAEGVTVELKSGGVTVASGVTDVNGDVCLDVPSSGTYDRVITGTLYTTTTQSVSLFCAENTGTAIIDPIEGYSCVRSCCDDQEGPPYPDVTWPTTLYLDDGIGVVTLTSASGDAPGPWYGSAARRAANAITCDNSGGYSDVTDVDVTIYFEAYCGIVGAYLSLDVLIGYFGCRNNVNCFGDSGQNPPNAVIPYLATNPTNTGCNANSSVYARINCSDGWKGAGDGAGHTGFGACSTNISPAPIHCPPTAISVTGRLTGTYSTITQRDAMWFQYSQIYGSTGAGTTKTVAIDWTLTS